jgi:hypothetical protein
MVFLHPATLGGGVFLASLLPPVVEITPPAPQVTGVSILPAGATLAGGAQLQLSAIVAGLFSPSQAVTWSRQPALGSVVAGLVTAPPATVARQKIYVKATSVEDPDFSATVEIVIPSIRHVVNVTILMRDQQNNPMVGADVVAVLDKADIDPVLGYVAPEQFTGTTDDDGILVLALWPNALGSLGSRYKFKIRNPDTGKYLRVSAVIPNEDCDLHEVAAIPEM